MFANLNLQLTTTTTTTTLDTAVEQPLRGIASGSPGGARQAPFSELLGMRIHPELTEQQLGGDGLPDSGKELPVFVPPGPATELEFPGTGRRAGADQSIELTPASEIDLRTDFPYAPSVPEKIDAPRSDGLIFSRPEAVESGRSIWTSIVQPSVTLTSLPGRTEKPVPVPEVAPLARTDQSAVSVSVTDILPRSLTGRTAVSAPVAEILPVSPTDRAAVFVPVAEILPREKMPLPTTTLKTAGVEVPPGTIKLSDMPAVDTVTAIARSNAGLEMQHRPAERLAPSSVTLSTTPIHLSTTLSYSAGDAASVRPATVLDNINTPVRDAAWGERLGERVLMLSAGQVKTAEIRLSPADLGPLRVRIGLDDGSANIAFHAQHAVTREAIELAMPRLREMLAESGLSLGNTDVSEQGVADGKAERDAAPVANGVAADEELDSQTLSDADHAAKSVSANNLLDTFV